TIEWEDEKTLENTTQHLIEMQKLLQQSHAEPKRSDGDVTKVLSGSKRVLESTFQAPFLPHATLEPMNFFAHVQGDKVELHGPTQTPARTRTAVAEKLGISEENITVGLSRQGGGFGRRLQADY